jgi:demethylmenaquinone methyltransferase/2-methoxy-6-polyprenyl-1,4-benzoquinol methylase
LKQNIYTSSYTAQLFNSLSRSYDVVNYITSFGFSTRWRRQFLGHLPPQQPKAVLDLMTGIGEVIPYLRIQYPGAEITALDISAGMLEAGRSKHTDVQFMQADILTYVPDKQYDIVVSAFGLKFFNDDQLQLIARTIAASLKPGGHFSLIETSSPANPILHLAYKIHLKYVVPAVGFVLSGGRKDFSMLWRYTEAYKSSGTVARCFREAGLTTYTDSYFWGCATGVHGVK